MATRARVPGRWRADCMSKREASSARPPAKGSQSMGPSISMRCRNTLDSRSVCWSALAMLPPESAMRLATAATMPGWSAHWRVSTDEAVGAMWGPGGDDQRRRSGEDGGEAPDRGDRPDGDHHDAAGE